MRNFILILAASTALAACASTGPDQTEVAAQTATLAEAAAGPVTPAPAAVPQIGSFGFDIAGMDRSVAPGENFYRYANGTWARTTPIPADRSNYGMFSVYSTEFDYCEGNGAVRTVGRSLGIAGKFYILDKGECKNQHNG